MNYLVLMRNFISIAVLFFAFASSALAETSGTTSIVAVVDDQAITSFELDQRVRLMIQGSKLTDNEETRKKLAPIIIRSMIDEKLHEKDAKKLGISLTDAMVDSAIAGIAERNGATVDSLKSGLQSQGIGFESLRRQVAAQLMWNKILNQRIKPKVKIRDDEILDALESNVAGETNPEEFQISEIVLPVDNPESEAKVKELADKLVSEIKGGASLANLAREFSKMTVSSDEELKKWVSPEFLDREVVSALFSANPGQVLEPVRTSGGYYVIVLHDKRSKGSEMFDAIVADLRQLVIPLSKDAKQDLVDEAEKQARTAAAPSNTCEEFSKTAAKTTDQSMINLGKMPLSNIMEPVRSKILSIGDGEKTKPFRTPYGFHVVMVCSKILTLPDDKKNELKQELLAKKMELEARKYMRGLRRDSLVEIRG